MSGVVAPGEGAVRHLYVHLPFCVHRCGYCDFVTVVGRPHEHEAYVDAVLAELRRERHVLAPAVETVFVGGGTPTFTTPSALRRLLAALPEAAEVTVEANPETVTAEVAALLRDHGVTRISVGAQSFGQRQLDVLERRASPDDVRRAVHDLRGVGFDNISLDLLYGVPFQGPADLAADLTGALALAPEHLSCYELEAKPGTRFAHAWGAELERQADAMETHLDQVVETLGDAGYRWYETANFCRDGTGRDAARDLRAHHNLAIWRGADYLGVGIGAVSTLGDVRRRNGPSVGGYLGALAAGEAPPREHEHLDAATRARERVMLGLRLDEPLSLHGCHHVVDDSALGRLVAGGLVERCDGDALRLTRRGRFLGGAVTAELLRWDGPDEADPARLRFGDDDRAQLAEAGDPAASGGGVRRDG